MEREIDNNPLGRIDFTDARDGGEWRELEVLQLLENEPQANQRRIATETRMSLGLANSCLRRLTRKGMIKIQEAPGRRYLYYLTPKGFAEKSRLTYEYIRTSVHFYSDARQRCRRRFARLRSEGAAELIFFGKSDLAEIAYLTLQEFDLRLAMIVDPRQHGAQFFQLTVQPVERLPARTPERARLIYTGTTPPRLVDELRGIDCEFLY